MKALFPILGVVLPPAAVAMHKGISGTFVVNLVLTVLGFLPGVIHALWTIAQPDDELALPPAVEAIRMNITQVL